MLEKKLNKERECIKIHNERLERNGIYLTENEVAKIWINQYAERFHELYEENPNIPAYKMQERLRKEHFEAIKRIS